MDNIQIKNEKFSLSSHFLSNSASYYCRFGMYPFRPFSIYTCFHTYCFYCVFKKLGLYSTYCFAACLFTVHHGHPLCLFISQSYFISFDICIEFHGP